MSADYDAQGLALAAAGSARRREAVERLRRAIARGGLPTVMAAPPTLSTTLNASAIASSATFSPLTGTSPNPLYYSFLGATWRQRGTGFPDTLGQQQMDGFKIDRFYQMVIETGLTRKAAVFVLAVAG